MSEALRIWYLVLAAAWFTIGVRHIALDAEGQAHVARSVFVFGLVTCLHFDRFRTGK